MAKILIIEDDQGIRQLIGEILSLSAFDCISFAEGKAALEYLEKNQNIDFLIFLDLVMPGMSGWEFLKRANKLRKKAKMKIVVITGLQATQRGDLDKSVDQILEKPFKIEDFLECINKFIFETEESKKAA